MALNVHDCIKLAWPYLTLSHLKWLCHSPCQIGTGLACLS